MTNNQEQNMLKEIYEELDPTTNLDYEQLDNQELAQHIIETKTMLEQQKQYMNMLEVEMLARLDSIEDGKLETPYGIFGSRWSKTYYRLDRQALEKALLSVEQTIDDDGEVLENADAKLYTVLKTCRLEPRKTELRKAGFNPDVYYEEMSSTQKLEIIEEK